MTGSRQGTRSHDVEQNLEGGGHACARLQRAPIRRHVGSTTDATAETGDPLVHRHRPDSNIDV